MVNNRPPALPLPHRENVQAFADPAVAARWADRHAGVRAVERGDNVITIFGAIGADFWDEGITAKSVTRQLRAIGGDVEVQINSPGGDVFEGFAIYNALREHPYNVTIKVIGMAASAASIIAMAGDTVQIGAAAFLMIHNCSVMGYGNKHDLRELADFLEPFDKALKDVYAARTGQKLDDLTKWLDAETYMSGAQAIELGFADDLLPSDHVTVDDDAKVKDRDANEIRGMERILIASGLTRTQARERLGKLKGKPDAAAGDTGQEAGSTQDAGFDLMGGLGSILGNLKSQLSHGG